MFTHKSINPRFMNNYYSFAFHNLHHSGKGGIAQEFLILFFKRFQKSKNIIKIYAVAATTQLFIYQIINLYFGIHRLSYDLLSQHFKV